MKEIYFMSDNSRISYRDFVRIYGFTTLKYSIAGKDRQGPSYKDIAELFKLVAKKENVDIDSLRLYSDGGAYSVYMIIE